jgi:hypothetical protein
MACKVDTRLLGGWLKDVTDVINVLHNERMKWWMHKDEIVLNTSECVVGDQCVKTYPMVVTTVGDMQPYTKGYLTFLYNQSNTSNFFRYQQAAHGNSNINNTSSQKIKNYCAARRRGRADSAEGVGARSGKGAHSTKDGNP